MLFWSTHPLLLSLIYPTPLACTNPSFYLLVDSSSYAHGANIHPLLSLVSYQLFSPCCLTHPEDTPQIKLHIYIDDITTSTVPSDTVHVSKTEKFVDLAVSMTRLILTWWSLISLSFDSAMSLTPLGLDSAVSLKTLSLSYSVTDTAESWLSSVIGDLKMLGKHATILGCELVT
jgi:hypothetical protein